MSLEGIKDILVKYYFMGKTKKQLGQMRINIKNRITILEEVARKDPLKKNKAVHEELEKLKKDLAESE